MGFMKTLLVSLGAIVLAVVAFAGQTQEVSRSQEILKTWERALQAKGGKERLERIQNLLIIDPRPKTPARPARVDLYAFPDKEWLWEDQGDSVLGLTLSVFDGDGSWIALSSRRNPPTVQRFPSNKPLEYNRILDVHGDYFLITSWVDAQPVALTTGRIGPVEYDLLTVDFRFGSEKKRVTYYVDRSTGLIRREVFPDYSGLAHDFENYKSIDGIMMPTRVTYTPQRFTYNFEFAFNVKFRPDIFTRRPSLENGPDGWRP